MLGDNALRRLMAWQNQATSPTQKASYADNGSGERVQQSVTSGGATTTTSYIGSDEEVSVTGGTMTLHRRTDRQGRPITFRLTAGQRHEATQAQALIEQRVSKVKRAGRRRPRQMCADKGLSQPGLSSLAPAARHGTGHPRRAP